MTEELRFAEEAATGTVARGDWPILIVDDDPEVHSATTLALEEFRFKGKGLRFLHAYSGREAEQRLREHPEIAMVLLDVVMESDHAGLKVVEYVRNTLNNRFIRVILRTGQPGQAPELEVITRYDINDYKYKTELTRERLFTTVYTALSTYRDLVALDANRRGLEKVIEASARLFELRSIERLAQGVLEQLTALLFLEQHAVMLHASGIAITGHSHTLHIVAATGRYETLVGRESDELPQTVLDRVALARMDCAHPVFGQDYFVGCQSSDGAGTWVFYIDADMPLVDPDRRLIELFCRNVAIARAHLLLRAGAQSHE